jgi:hypothetical protein
VAFPEDFMASVLGMWTQSDRQSRRASLEELFRPDAQFHDPDGEFVGYDALERFSDPCNHASPKPGSRWNEHAGGFVLRQRRDVFNAELLCEPERVGVQPVFDELAILDSERVGDVEGHDSSDRVGPTSWMGSVDER